MTITDFQWVHLGKPGAYLIENDGTDSILHYSASFPDAGASWTSTNLSGVFTKIRVGSTAGQVYVITDQEEWCHTFDFTIDDGGFTPSTYGSYSAGVGWVETTAPLGAAINIELTFSSAIITAMSVDLEFGVVGSGRNLYAEVTPDAYINATTLGAGPQTHSGTGSTTGTNIRVNPSTGDNVYDTITITSITVCGTGANPFGGSSSGTLTRYSSTYGASFAADQYAGASPGAMVGFDTAKNGSIVMVGTAGQVMKASAGGAYAAYGTGMPANFVPAAIWIPRYQFTSSTTLNNATNPEFLVASNIEDDDGGTVYRVTAGGNTWTDVSPDFGGVGLAVSVDCISMPYRSGKYMSAVLDFGGTTKLVTSTASGGSWLDRGGILGALSVRYQRGDTSLQKLFIACAGGLVVSQNHGSLLQTRLSPGPTALLGCEPFA